MKSWRYQQGKTAYLAYVATGANSFFFLLFKNIPVIFTPLHLSLQGPRKYFYDDLGKRLTSGQGHEMT